MKRDDFSGPEWFQRLKARRDELKSKIDERNQDPDKYAELWRAEAERNWKLGAQGVNAGRAIDPGVSQVAIFQTVLAFADSGNKAMNDAYQDAIASVTARVLAFASTSADVNPDDMTITLTVADDPDYEGVRHETLRFEYQGEWQGSVTRYVNVHPTSETGKHVSVSGFRFALAPAVRLFNSALPPDSSARIPEH